HLALVVQPAEPQHDREVEADRYDDREIAGRGEGDQRKYDLTREIVGRGLRQYARQLIGQQDHQQHDRYRETRHGDFAKDVPVQRAHRCGRLRHFREESSWNFSSVSAVRRNSAPIAPSSACTTKALCLRLLKSSTSASAAASRGW